MPALVFPAPGFSTSTYNVDVVGSVDMLTSRGLSGKILNITSLKAGEQQPSRTNKSTGKIKNFNIFRSEDVVIRSGNMSKQFEKVVGNKTEAVVRPPILTKFTTIINRNFEINKSYGKESTVSKVKSDTNSYLSPKLKSSIIARGPATNNNNILAQPIRRLSPPINDVALVKNPVSAIYSLDVTEGLIPVTSSTVANGRTTLNFASKYNPGSSTKVRLVGYNTVTLPATQNTYTFNGTSNYVSLPYQQIALPSSTTPFTVECWINLSQATGCIIMSEEYTVDTICMTLGIGSAPGGSGTRVWFGYNDGSTWRYALSSQSLKANTWYHIAGSFTGSQARLFINGQLDGTADLTWITNSGTSLFIGRRWDTYTGDGEQVYFPGTIANIRIVKGTALYFNSFTPPGYIDATVPGTVLLINSSSIIDTSSINNVVTVNSAPVIGNSTLPIPGPLVTSDVIVYDSITPLVSSNNTSVTLATSSLLSASKLSVAFVNTFVSSNVTYNILSLPITIGTHRTVPQLKSVARLENIINAGRIRNVQAVKSDNVILPQGTNLNKTSIKIRADNVARLNTMLLTKLITPSNKISFFESPKISKVAVATKIKADGSRIRLDTLKIADKLSSISTSLQLGNAPRDVKKILGLINYNDYKIYNRTTATTIIYGDSIPVTGVSTATGYTTYQFASRFINPNNTKVKLIGLNTVNSPAQQVFYTFNGSSRFDVTPAFSPSTMGNFGTGDFTVEFWIYPRSFASTPVFFGAWTNNFPSYITGQWEIYANTSGGVVLIVAGGSMTLNFGQTFGTLALNTWQHLAVVRNNGVISVYINGVTTSNPTFTGQVGYTDMPIRIGGEIASRANYFTGDMSNIRMINGVALYKTNTAFSLPGSFTPTINNTTLAIVDINYRDSSPVTNTVNNVGRVVPSTGYLPVSSTVTNTVDVTVYELPFDMVLTTSTGVTVANTYGNVVPTNKQAIQFGIQTVSTDVTSGILYNTQPSGSVNKAFEKVTGDNAKIVTNKLSPIVVLRPNSPLNNIVTGKTVGLRTKFWGTSPITYTRITTSSSQILFDKQIAISSYARSGNFLTFNFSTPITYSNTINRYTAIKIESLNTETLTQVSSGAAEFTTPGATTWTCPAGITEVSVVCVGGGGTGYGNSGRGAGGGGGGGLGYRRGIPVTSGTIYTVVVGAGAQGNLGQATPAGDSYFISTATVAGLGGLSATAAGAGAAGGGFVGDGGGAGGKGGDYGTAGASNYGGGGGGAGGYAGSGGQGATGGNGNSLLGIGGPAPLGGGGGGGGAGGWNDTNGNGNWSGSGGAGGGVGILGQGSSGGGGAQGFGEGSAGGGGVGGSSGNDGGGGGGGFITGTTAGGVGGGYGGGSTGPTFNYNGGSRAAPNGAGGAVRIVFSINVRTGNTPISIYNQTFDISTLTSTSTTIYLPGGTLPPDPTTYSMVASLGFTTTITTTYSDSNSVPKMNIFRNQRFVSAAVSSVASNNATEFRLVSVTPAHSFKTERVRPLYKIASDGVLTLTTTAKVRQLPKLIALVTDRSIPKMNTFKAPQFTSANVPSVASNNADKFKLSSLTYIVKADKLTVSSIVRSFPSNIVTSRVQKVNQPVVDTTLIKSYNKTTSVNLVYGDLLPITASTSTTLYTTLTFPFNYASGTATSLKITGTTPVIDQTAYPPVNYSMSFNGGAYISLANSPVFNLAPTSSSPWSVEMWVRPTGNYTNFNTLFAKRFTNIGTAWEGYLRISTGVISFFNGSNYESTVTLPSNTWSHCAWVFDGVRINIYVNGISVYSSPITNADGNYPLTIGGTVDTGYSFQEAFIGQIANFRVIKGVALYNNKFIPASVVNQFATGTSLVILGPSILDLSVNSSANAITNNGVTMGSAVLPTSSWPTTPTVVNVLAYERVVPIVSYTATSVTFENIGLTPSPANTKISFGTIFSYDVATPAYIANTQRSGTLAKTIVKVVTGDNKQLLANTLAKQIGKLSPTVEITRPGKVTSSALLKEVKSALNQTVVLRKITYTQTGVYGLVTPVTGKLRSITKLVNTRSILTFVSFSASRLPALRSYVFSTPTIGKTTSINKFVATPVQLPVGKVKAVAVVRSDSTPIFDVDTLQKQLFKVRADLANLASNTVLNRPIRFSNFLDISLIKSYTATTATTILYEDAIPISAVSKGPTQTTITVPYRFYTGLDSTINIQRTITTTVSSLTSGTLTQIDSFITSTIPTVVTRPALISSYDATSVTVNNLDIDIDPSNTTVSFGRPINYSTVSSTTAPNARSSGGLSKQILNLRTDPSKISVNSLSKRITHVRATGEVSKPNKIILSTNLKDITNNLTRVTTLRRWAAPVSATQVFFEPQPGKLKASVSVRADSTSVLRVNNISLLKRVLSSSPTPIAISGVLSKQIMKIVGSANNLSVAKTRSVTKLVTDVNRHTASAISKQILSVKPAGTVSLTNRAETVYLQSAVTTSVAPTNARERLYYANIAKGRYGILNTVFGQSFGPTAELYPIGQLTQTRGGTYTQLAKFFMNSPGNVFGNGRISSITNLRDTRSLVRQSNIDATYLQSAVRITGAPTNARENLYYFNLAPGYRSAKSLTVAALPNNIFANRVSQIAKATSVGREIQQFNLDATYLQSAVRTSSAPTNARENLYYFNLAPAYRSAKSLNVYGASDKINSIAGNLAKPIEVIKDLPKNFTSGNLQRSIAKLTSENNKYVPSKINSGIVIRGTRSELPSRTTTVVRSTALTYDTLSIPISGRTANTANVASWYINDKDILTIIPVGTSLITLYFGYVPYTIDFTTVLSSRITALRNYSYVPIITSYNQNSVTIVDPGNFPSISNMYIQWGRNVITESYSNSDNNTVPQFTRPKFNNFLVVEQNRSPTYLDKKALVVRPDPNNYYIINQLTRSLRVSAPVSSSNIVTGRTRASIKARGDGTSLDNFGLKIFKLPSTKTQMFELSRHTGAAEVSIVVREDSLSNRFKAEKFNVALRIKDVGISLASGITNVNPIKNNRLQIFELPTIAGAANVELVVRAHPTEIVLSQGIKRYPVISLSTDRGFASTTVKLAMRDTPVLINQGRLATWVIKKNYIFDTATAGSTTVKLPIRGIVNDQSLIGVMPVRSLIKGVNNIILTDPVSLPKPVRDGVQGFFTPAISLFNSRSINIKADSVQINLGRIKLTASLRANVDTATSYGNFKPIKPLSGDYRTFDLQKLVIKPKMNDEFSNMFVLTEGKLTAFNSKFNGIGDPGFKAPVPIQFWS